MLSTQPRAVSVSALILALLMMSTPDTVVAQGQSAGTTDVTVTVFDSSGGAIRDATVVLGSGSEERRATTGDDGRAQLMDVSDGPGTVEVFAEGFLEVRRSFVAAGEAISIDVVLAVAGVSERVQVRGTITELDAPATGGTRLSLPARDLPATLNVITQARMQELGAFTATDAIELASGTVASDGLGAQLPGYQARGFSGSITHDGIRQNTTVQSSRPVDTFLFDRIEVLKGPATLISGEGPPGGTVNYVSKSPAREFGVDTMLSYGSFDAVRVGFGMTGPLGDNLTGRIDLSYSDENGYTSPMSQELRAVAGSLEWTPSSIVTVGVHGKLTDDHINPYFATPFINGEVDPRIRDLNYNLQDAFSAAENNFGRVNIDVTVPSGWHLRNEVFAATQLLNYRNMESYAYNEDTQLVDVRGYFLIRRDDVLVGNRFEADRSFDLLGRPVHLVLGGELQHNDMTRARNPPEASAVRFSVDPFAPEPLFDPGLDLLRVPDVLVNTRTLFGEAQVPLAERWTAVLGLRWEDIDVDYSATVGSAEVLNEVFQPITGRAGLVYAVNDDVNLYGSFSRSVEPATQFVSITGCCGSAEFFELTPGRQYEVGVKGGAFDGRLEGTFAYYNLAKENIPTRTIVDEIPVDQLIGRQVSRGVELSFLARPTGSLTILGDVAATNAEFADFDEVVGDMVVSRDGNVPRNVPRTVWRITPIQRIGRINIGATLHVVGERWGDVANTRLLETYKTVDAWVTIPFPGGAQLSFRGRNLGDELYIRLASTSRGRIAAPRSFETVLTAGF